ncbi:MAG: arginine repressor [Clostridiales bacterium]|nr:arginine repressor [Clostridiales bacterium]
MKRNRQEALIEIIKTNEVSTQGDLTALLKEQGYNVTQATVSRDIRDLKIIKLQGPNGRLRYGVSDTKNSVSHTGAVRIFKEGITSVDHAGNIVIVKTLSGMANAVCAGIDAMEDKDILGTVAGDDTIMCVVRDLEACFRLVDRLGNSE